MATPAIKQTHEIDPVKVLEELKWLALAICTDQTRFNIARVHVDGTSAIATDGHRMHVIDGTCMTAGFSLSGTATTRILDLAKDYRLIDVQVWDGASRWKFESPDGSCDVVCNRGDYNFPTWEQVIPTGVHAELKTADVRKVYVGTETKVDYCMIGLGHFNARYVAEALRGAPKLVSATLGGDAHAPVLLSYGNRRAVVMPVRQ
jgi:hypothetical protein